MKKFLALLCALLMCLTFVLVSCGDDKNGDGNGNGNGDNGGGETSSVQAGMDNPFGDYTYEDETENDNVVEF